MIKTVEIRAMLFDYENDRMKRTIVSDLKIYKESSITEIQKRIGEEILQKKIWEQLNVLISEGKVCKSGANRWTKYKITE